MTLATAIIEATERSMPPTSTTTVMPAVAKAKGSAARPSASKPDAPKPGWISLVTTASSDQQADEPEHPAAAGQQPDHASAPAPVSP